MAIESLRHHRSGRRAKALIGTAALVGALFAAPQASAATQGDGTPGLATCINQIIASGHAELLEGNPTFVVGTPGDDWGPGGSLYGIGCGLAGNDYVSDMFGPFVGGPGNDSIGAELFGLFIGGAGDDYSFDVMAYGDPGVKFDGGPGNDTGVLVSADFNGGPGNDTAEWLTGTFYGGPGDDKAVNVARSAGSGTFVGGMGNDSVDLNDTAGVVYGNVGNDTVTTNKGRFDGGAGNDTVKVNYGTFIGGPGYDVVLENHGTCKGVEVGC